MFKSRIEKELEKDRKEFEEQQRDIRVLLLGTGDSGKTTLLKQLQLIHGQGFAPNLEEYKNVAIDFILGNMIHLVNHVDLHDTENHGDSAIHVSYMEDKDILMKGRGLDANVAAAIQRLWNHPSIRKESENLHHSLIWFIERAHGFANKSYMMSNQDVLNLRKVTTEISETPIRIGQSKFRFYDVPGQRGYRKQWIQFFDNASAVMFVTSLTFYREYLKKEESPEMPNALLDSVECFRDINKSPLMKHDMCVLIMSKFDLIGRLMQTDRIEKHFPEVAGHYGDFITAEDKRQFVTFVSKKFEKVLPKNREFAAHIVTCNDTGAVSAVLHSITQNIVFRILKTNGIF